MQNCLIDDIIDLEWEFFDSTKNIGSRAFCQDKKENFVLSRRAYWKIYHDEILQLYKRDLLTAKENGINLVAQKYGYMMQNTDVENYNKIKSDLIPVCDEKLQLIDKILPICLKWELEVFYFQSANANIINRPMYSSQDSISATSVETYFRGELSTYSVSTLNEILQYFKILEKQKRNVILEVFRQLQNGDI